MNSLAISLEVLQNGGAVEEKIGVGLLEMLLSLRVGLEGLLELVDVLVVSEVVRHVGISQNIPGLRVLHVEADRLVGELDRKSEVLLALLLLRLLNLAADH